MSDLTADEKTVLTYALTGNRRDGKVYRNHFYHRTGSDDMLTAERLVAKGLMFASAPWDEEDGRRCYHCTTAGAAAVGFHLSVCEFT